MSAAFPPRPTFNRGDLARPKPGNMGAGLPSGRVTNWVRWGYGQILYIEDEKRPQCSGLFDRVETAAGGGV